MLSTRRRTEPLDPRTTDGTRVALDVRDQEDDIWIWDFARETLTRLTFDPSQELYPTWAPDGLQVALGSNGDPNRLLLKAADSTGTDEVLVELTDASFNISVRSMDGDGTITPLLATEFNEINAELSPNGAWLAYQSNASGQNEIYVRPFPDLSRRWHVSTDGGDIPRWSPNGSELFYLAGSRMMAVDVDTTNSDELRFGTPTELYSSPQSASSYATDGTRFVHVVQEPLQLPDHLNLALNWYKELERLVPTTN